MFDWQRPASRVIELRPAGSGRRVIGWRARSIADTLDACAQLEGDLYLASDVVVSVAEGARYWRTYAAKNREAKRANSRLQSAKVRQRQRQDHAAYVQRLAAEIPWATPIGFKRWAADWWRTWRTDPAGCIFETRRTADTAAESRRKVSEWLWGSDKRGTRGGAPTSAERPSF